jgi:uncharacterized OsmC-like protein
MENAVKNPVVNGIDLTALSEVAAAIQAAPDQGCVGFCVKTRWTGRTRSESLIESYEMAGKRIDRRFKIVSDEPEELLGTNSAPNPQELLMSALNACMTVGYVAQAAVRGIELDMLEIETSGQLDLRGFLELDDAVPPGYRQLDCTVRLAGNGSTEQFRDIHEAVMKTSPNFFNLAQPICMNGRIEVIDVDSKAALS